MKDQEEISQMIATMFNLGTDETSSSQQNEEHEKVITLCNASCSIGYFLLVTNPTGRLVPFF